MRNRRGEAYGHSIVRYSRRWSSMRPASSTSTLTPAMASWNAAMPPAAPLPTTMTSHCVEPGLTAAASRRDSSVTAARSRSRVGSAAILRLRFLPAVRAILAVDGMASHELGEDLVPLVAQLLVDADLRRVVRVDRRLLGGDEEPLHRRLPELLRRRGSVQGGVGRLLGVADVGGPLLLRVVRLLRRRAGLGHLLVAAHVEEHRPGLLRVEPHEGNARAR